MKPATKIGTCVVSRKPTAMKTGAAAASREPTAMVSGASDTSRKPTAMESARSDASRELPAMKTGASDAPPQFVRRIAPRRIVCDDREAGSGVPEALALRPDVHLTYHHLSLGDYRVDDTLIIERKTVTDFARSIRDGRLFNQASRLARCRSARPCLILEGARINHWSGALPRTAFQGALITVTLIFGIALLRSSCPEETATLILYAVDQLCRRTVNLPKRCGYHPKGTNRQQSYLLQAIPGIGPLKAKRLLDAFGSPAGVANACARDLAMVEGIGPVAAEEIHRVFHEL